MIINSDFHDFYDPVIKNTGVDKSVVYNRKTTVLKERYGLSLNGYEEMIKGGWAYSGIGIIILAGVSYPFVQRYQTTTGVKTFTYGEDKCIEFIEHTNRSHRSGRRYYSSYWKQRYLDRFEDVISTVYVDDCIKYKTPVLGILPISEDGRLSEYKLIANPVLKKYNFQKALDPYQTYQVIYNFISGVLPGRSVEPRPITDVQRARNHGFDKWSFRKEKHQRKG